MRKEQGSITMIVFATVIFILIILGTTYTSMTYKRKSQAVELEELKEIYSMEGETKLKRVYNETALRKNMLDGSGTEGDPYKIYTIEDLVRFSNRTNAGDSFNGKFLELMNDLDFNQDGSYENPSRIDYGDVNGNGTIEPLKTELTTGKGWPAIGGATPFTGKFYGNNHTISSLHMNTTANNQGLFGVSSGIIQDLTVRGSITTSGAIVGGIAGYLNQNSKIDNCKNYVEINQNISSSQESGYAGGIAGYSAGNITSSANYGDINSELSTGRATAGGIVAINRKNYK